MKKTIKTFVATTMLFYSALSFANETQDTENTQTEPVQIEQTEPVQVEQTDCTYTKSTHDQCVSKATELIQSQRTLVQNIKDEHQKETLNTELNSVEKKLNTINKVSNKKKEGIYKDVMNKLHDLKERIEKATV